jgi:acylphosphatase
MTTKSRARACVNGTVQGVGYRWFTQRRADSYGITGFVRNQPDGSVLVEAEGDRELVEQFLGELRDGPTFARVANVSVEWITTKHDHFFDVTS